MRLRQLATLVFSLSLGLLLFLALAPSEVHAQTPITVTTATDSDTADGDCSLREAIIAANNDTAYNGCSTGSGVDGITFAGNYTITLGSALPAITSSVTITGTGTANTIIQASTCNPVIGGCIPADWRVFTVMTGTVTMKDMTIRHGNCQTGGACTVNLLNGGNIYVLNADLTLDGANVQSGHAQSDGGGIYSTGGNLTLLNNSLIGGQGTGNKTDTGDGGGIKFLNGGGLLLDSSRVAYNYAFGYSGGIYFDNSNTATLQNGSQIDHNTAEPTNGDYAGGMYAFGVSCQFNVNSSTISENTSGGQAGGLWTRCATTITDSTIYSNTTTNSGGGIYVFNLGVVTITNSTIYSNTAGFDGGGIFTTGVLNVSNSTLTDNSATNRGGGIFDDGGILNLYNSTLAGNTGGAGLYLYDNRGNGPMTLYNSILSNNTGGDCIVDGGVTFTADSFNLDSDGSCDNATQKTVGEINLGPLADNGGSTQTMALLTGSSAIDAGDNTVCAAAPVNNLDQRGVTRPQGDTCDVGAYEAKDEIVYLPIIVK